MSGFDIIYATLDEEFDRAHGVHSMVAWLGPRARAAGVGGAPRWRRSRALVAAPARVAARRAPLGAGVGVRRALVAALAVTGVLLYLEQRWAEDVNLAFFKVNVCRSGFAGAAPLVLRRRARPRGVGFDGRAT